MSENTESVPMTSSPAVRCAGCRFAWNSNAMAEGLRVLGSCPKCGGELAFRDAPPEPPRFTVAPRTSGPAPHLVLGIPRR